MTTLATERQLSYIQALASERIVPDSIKPRIGGTMTKALASTVIDLLLAAPRAPRADEVTNPDPVTEPGAYRRDGVIYRVRKSRQTGSLYAMRLQQSPSGGWSFVFERGLIKSLSASDRMTLEEAMFWGVQTGCCCICGALLTDPKSIKRGIGPVCAKRV